MGSLPAPLLALGPSPIPRVELPGFLGQFLGWASVSACGGDCTSFEILEDRPTGFGRGGKPSTGALLLGGSRCPKARTVHWLP